MGYLLYALLVKLGWDFCRWNMVDWFMRFFLTSDREPSRSGASHSSATGSNTMRLTMSTREREIAHHKLLNQIKAIKAPAAPADAQQGWTPYNQCGKPRAVTYTTNRGTEKEETSGHEERRLALCNGGVVRLDPRETAKALPFKLSREAERDLAKWG